MLERGRLWLEDVDGRGVNVKVSTNGCCGESLNTEYSSANIGVHPERLSKALLFTRGVSKVGLGKTRDVGVRVGVGG